MSVNTKTIRFRPLLFGGLLTSLGVAAVIMLLRDPRADAAPAAETEAARFGVERLRVALSAAGHVLDFRYRVVDAQKAASFQRRNSRAYLLHQRSGERLTVPTSPKTGALRNTSAPHAGKTYFTLFSNPGRLVQRGERVTIVIGGFKARDLLVE